MKTERNTVVRNGRLRVHVGMLPGCGQRQGILKAYQMAHQQGLKVVCLPENPLSENPFDLPVWEPLTDLPPHKAGLWEPEVMRLLLETKPDMVVLDSLNRFDLTPEQHHAKRQGLQRLLREGINVETTLDLVAVNLFSDLLNPTYNWPEGGKVSPSFLRQSVSDYVVHDLPPTLILQRFYEGQMVLPRPLESQRAVFTNIANLSRLREALFALVGAHVTDQVRANNPGLTDLDGSRDSRGLRWDVDWKNLLYVLGGGTALLLMLHYLWVQWYLSLSAVSVVLLGAVVLSALTYSLATTILASLIAFVGLDLLFLSPFTVDVLSAEDALTLAVFVGVGTMVGYVATRRQADAQLDRISMGQHLALLRLAYDLNTVETVEDCLEAGVRTLKAFLNVHVFVALVNEDDTLRVWPETKLDEVERAAIAEALAGNQFSRAKSPQIYSYCPLYLTGRVLGVIGFGDSKTKQVDPSWQALDFLRSYANLLAGGLTRVLMKQVSNEASLQATRESLRSALLSSISHDLKTPLVGIIGSLSTLEHAGKGLPQEDQQELVAASRREAERLHSIIHNVLEVTKLESGSLQPKREHVSPVDLIGEAVRRTQKYHAQLQVALEAPQDVPDLEVDPILMGQVFYNLFDNAAKYAGADRPIEVRLAAVTEDETRLQVDVADEGPGIAPGEENKVFDKFFRTEKGDHKVAGSGLGLAICRGIVEAHGGSIKVANRNDGKGAVFSMVLPAVEKSSIKEERV
ncbi:MAG: DUF4118 domain-containing protein [Proteobacteria bacterium]|nr:DUF4118 domain-containing protein [Pseudomonadota bacterium]